MDKAILKSRTVWAGILTAVAGYLQVAYAVTVDAEAQARIVDAAFGLFTILTGKGAILFRILAAMPKIKELENTVKTIWREIDRSRASGSPPPGGPVSP